MTFSVSVTVPRMREVRMYGIAIVFSESVNIFLIFDNNILAVYPMYFKEKSMRIIW
jgi:hypothetical protein